MVGRIPEARWRIVSRYSKAMRTGFGSVLITKFSRVWIWGRIFGNKGALGINDASMKILRERSL